MKVQAKKLGNAGNIGNVAVKGGKVSAPKAKSMQSKLDAKTYGSAMGILNKHFK